MFLIEHHGKELLASHGIPVPAGVLVPADGDISATRIPDGPVIAKVPRKFKPPAGDAYVRLESARGDMGWYCVSDGTEYPYRVRVRTGSFTATSIIDKVSRGLMLADLIAVVASFDLVAPEIDR